MRRFLYVAAALAAITRSGSGRRLMVAGSAGRIAYGLVCLFAPRFVSGRWAAPSPDSPLNLRGFGGQHVTLGAYTLLCARSDRLAPQAALLNVGAEIGDTVAGCLELRERGTQEAIAVGAVTLPLVNLATWPTAAWRVSRDSGRAAQQDDAVQRPVERDRADEPV